MPAEGEPVRYVTRGQAQIAYQVAGSGPSIVLIKNNRRPAQLGAASLLSKRFRVFQIHPVGFGLSDRPSAHDFGDIGSQVLAVLDREGVDRFVVWGFSQPAAMAAMVARSTERAVALVAGGFGLIGVPMDATMRRMEREPRMPRPAIEFWRGYRAVDWVRALRGMKQVKLAYVGALDPAGPRMRRDAQVLRYCGCDYLEFADLDHTTSGLANGSADVILTVLDWLERNLGGTW